MVAVGEGGGCGPPPVGIYLIGIEPIDHHSGDGKVARRPGGTAALESVEGLAALAFPVHPHMVRHSTGYYLAHKRYDTRLIQGYLGHREVRQAARYTKLNAGRFEGL